MNQPLLYSQNNQTQRRDTAGVLNDYSQVMQWRVDGGDAVLDVGCGTGDVTNDLLLPVLPNTFGKLVGIDISEEMIEFAQKRYQNPKVFFAQMDIATENVPVNYVESFDHVFSFYCLHWVQDQRKAMTNIEKMLKPGGDVLLTFLAVSSLYDMIESMANIKRWKSYMTDFKKYISPSHYLEEPGKEFENILGKAKLKTGVCKIQEFNYPFPNLAAFQGFLTALLPFYKRIPENLQEDYISDCVTEFKQLDLYETKDGFNLPYKLLIAYATKP